MRLFASMIYLLSLVNADLAQLAEHLTSNEEVGGSNPLVSIIDKGPSWKARPFFCIKIIRTKQLGKQ